MKRVWILLAVVTLVATLALQGGKVADCNSVAAETAEVGVDDEGTYKNHGQFVRAAAAYLDSVFPNISEECHSCIMSGFAQSDANNGSCSFPSGEM
jgi:hypothetical protein